MNGRFIAACAVAGFITTSAVARDQAPSSPRADTASVPSAFDVSLALDPVGGGEERWRETSLRSGRSAAALDRLDLGAMSSLNLDPQDAASEAVPADAPDTSDLAATAGRAGPGIGAASATDEWRISLIAYVWLPIRMTGDSSIAGKTVSLDATIGDVFDKFNPFGLAGRVEAWHHDTFGLILDGSYVRLKSKDLKVPLPPPGLSVPADLTIEQGIVDFIGSWRFFKRSLTETAGGPRIWVDLLGGVRWQYLDQSLDISGGPSLGGSENWFEPLVGARFVWQMNDTWALMIRGDASGFGVGDASDLTWNLVAGAAWSVNEKFLIQFAYKFQSLDYDNDEQGPDQIGIDMDLHGPYLGFAWSF